MLLLVTTIPLLKVKETTTTRVTISIPRFPLSNTLEFLRQRFAKMILYIKFSVVFCQVCCYLMPSTLTPAFSVFCFVISFVDFLCSQPNTSVVLDDIALESKF